MDDDDIITITGDSYSDSTILGSGYSSDTITLNSYTGSYSAAGIGGASGSSSTYTINGGGYAAGPVYTTTGTGNTAIGYGAFTNSNGTSWTTATNPATIKVSGDAEFDGEVKIKGKNLSEFMETLEKRLAILVPDPKKLEKYEALQKAYNHYKMLEALCDAPDEDDSK